MGIFNLKKKSAGKFIKNQFNKSALREKFEVEKVLKVGVLAEADLYRAYDFTKGLSQKLKMDQNDIAVCLIEDANQKNSSLEFNVINENDFGVYGKIKSAGLKDFVDRKFDLLINYCEDEMIFAQVIMIRSKAKLKAGFESEANFFNDISINIPGNKIDTFNIELVKYLEILKLIK